MLIGTTIDARGKLLKPNFAAVAPVVTATELEDYSVVQVTQTTANVAVTIPTPTNADILANHQLLTIINSSTSTTRLGVTTVSGTVYVAPGRQETFVFSNTGTVGWYAETDDEAKPVVVVQPAVVGNNVVTHNLALTAGTFDNLNIEAWHVATGNPVSFRLMPGLSTSNAVTVRHNMALASVRYVILG